IEYAKADDEDILIRVTAHNRGPEAAELHLLPQVFFRNTWSWGDMQARPQIVVADNGVLEVRHENLGTYTLQFEDHPELLFTDNDTNVARLYGAGIGGRCFKDGFHDYIVNNDASAISRNRCGTKAGLHFVSTIQGGASLRVRLRLTRGRQETSAFRDFDTIFA